ncbi:MAG: protein translocase subunit SecD [Phycisphaerae bacterium]
MPEKNLWNRMALILGVVVVACFLLYPPKERLRPGLDIAGGVSMIFEIDDTGMKDVPNLAEEVKTLLQRRVDPSGVYNLTWRVHGRNRLEIQMPLPPAEAAQRRNDYTQTLESLFEANLSRGDVETALRLPAEERNAKLAEMSGGVAERQEKLSIAAARYDAYAAALAARQAGPQTQPADGTTQPADGTTQPATQPTEQELELRLRDATEDYEDALDAVLGTALDPRRFQDVLEMDPGSEARRNSLAELKTKHPELAPKVDVVLEKYAAWAKYRSFLDGPADLQRLLRGAGVLEFRILAEPTPENASRHDLMREQLQKRGPRPGRGDTEGWFRIDNPISFFNVRSQADLQARDPRSFAGMVVDTYQGDWYVLAKLGESDGLLAGSQKKWQLKRAWPGRDEHGQPCVYFEFDVLGGSKFRELTRRNVQKQLCIFIDSVAYSSANILQEIGSMGTIHGDFSQEKVRYLVNTMQAGALPARLKETPISERTIGSSLGETNLKKAVNAGLIGAALVIVLMISYYLVCGAVANVAMLMNTLLVLAVMAMLGARFTLDGIAGLILGIGMAVDANVLIYERMREEKERGASLRMIIKNGYDKAFSTIFDSNVTTLLTSIIIYYVGSEEVKGFGLTLGWGVAMNLFTSVFVTRTLFALLVKYHVIKGIRMNKLIGVPNIDWVGLRRYFIPLSLFLTIGGMALLLSRGTRDYLDVEFLGGVSADIELKPAAAGAERFDDIKIAARLREAGDRVTADARKLGEATVEPITGEVGSFAVRVAGLDADRLVALLTEPLEDANLVQRDGVSVHAGGQSLGVRVKEDVTVDRLRAFIREQQSRLAQAGENIAMANVGSVREAGAEGGAGRFWNITTTETNKLLVQDAIVDAIGERLKVSFRVGYTFHGDDGRPYPIDDRRLESAVPGLPAGVTGDLSDFIGGAAMYFEDLDPPQPVDPAVPGSIYDRIRNMRLQPGYQDFPWRRFAVFGVTPAGKNDEGVERYSAVVVAVVDPNFVASEDPERWTTEFAMKELGLVKATLDSEQALRKVTQFKPQIANQAKVQATLALILSWAMIIAYLWIRFGRPIYGVAGVTALIHDVLMALAFVGLSGWIAGILLIEDFRINMTIIAALLTIIGFSINDSIVIFDRIRETRGRMRDVSRKIINDAINQTFSRTIITSLTVFMTLLSLYIFGGSSIRGFAFCMLIGVITGSYSTLAIAAPLLLVPSPSDERR